MILCLPFLFSSGLRGSANFLFSNRWPWGPLSLNLETAWAGCFVFHPSSEQLGPLSVTWWRTAGVSCQEWGEARMCAGRNAFLFRPREDNMPFGVFERLKRPAWPAPYFIHLESNRGPARSYCYERPRWRCHFLRRQSHYAEFGPKVLSLGCFTVVRAKQAWKWAKWTVP